jgi:hypothetical protein
MNNVTGFVVTGVRLKYISFYVNYKLQGGKHMEYVKEKEEEEEKGGNQNDFNERSKTN